MVGGVEGEEGGEVGHGFGVVLHLEKEETSFHESLLDYFWVRGF